MKKIDQLMTERRSARAFDENYQIPKVDLDALLTSIRMSPSSMGILSQRLLVLTDKKIKDDMAPFFFNQQNYLTSNVYLIFIGTLPEALKEKVNQTFDYKFGKGIQNETRNIFEKNAQKYVGEEIEEKIRWEWSIKQSFIAVGVATAAAAQLNIDTCILEGYDANKVKEYLVKNNIISKNEHPFISMAIGKSTKVSGEKLRTPEDDFFIYK